MRARSALCSGSWAYRHRLRPVTGLCLGLVVNESLAFTMLLWLGEVTAKHMAESKYALECILWTGQRPAAVRADVIRYTLHMGCQRVSTSWILLKRQILFYSVLSSKRANTAYRSVCSPLLTALPRDTLAVHQLSETSYFNCGFARRSFLPS